MTAPGPPLLTRGLATVMVTLLLGAMVPNMLVIAPDFLGRAGYDEQRIGLVMGGFNVASLATMPLVGWLAARLGLPRLLAAGCALAALGAGMFAAATTLPGLVAARALQGAGFGAVLVGAGAYVAETAPMERMGEALGLSGVLTLAAQAVGPVVGEALRRAGWDVVFLAAAGCGAAGAAVALALPRPAVASTAGAAPAAGGARAVLLAIALAGVGFGAVWSFLADHARQLGVGRTSWFFVPYVIAAVGTRLRLGTLADRLGRRRVAVPALLGHAVAVAALGQAAEAWHLVAIGLGYGLCHGLYYPTLQAMVVERAGARRGGAVAASSFAFGLGVLAAALGLGALARVAGYPALYAVAAALTAASVAVVGRAR